MSNSILLLLLSAALSEPATDFGVRTVGFDAPAPVFHQRAVAVRGGFDLYQAAEVVGRYGRVTSTRRSQEHNRRVGGVPNSWHLQGRAIDVVRSPQVSHATLAAKLRSLGYYLIESLDEGDHSHFAFGTGASGPRRANSEQIAEVRMEANYFRFVEAPRSGRVQKRSALR